ncbi:MAG TPA: dienelactone hydrolase family protein [Gemmatimonadales bacterium]|nr:dienelactone hydrolase family protein [Gemmatimonadales bacterium]
MRKGALSTVMVALAGVAAGAIAMWALGGRVGPRFDSMPTTHGEWVTIRRPDGAAIRAYVAYPERKDKAPAILVIHEIFGLTNWEPTVVDRLAGAGYVAIVPDLLSSRFGATPADPDSGRKLTALLDPAQVDADLDAAYAYLDGLPAVRRDDIATIGFCWGGGRSFEYATANPRLRAAVVCYGPPPDSARIARIKARVLGVYGESDERIDATLPDVARWMQAAGVSYAYDVYPGTGHGFLKPGRKGSDTDQVDRAWARILQFYRETLE